MEWLADDVAVAERTRPLADAMVKVSVRRPRASSLACEGRHPEPFIISATTPLTG
jgi:hypothetical protein